MSRDVTAFYRVVIRSNNSDYISKFGPYSRLGNAKTVLNRELKRWYRVDGWIEKTLTGWTAITDE